MNKIFRYIIISAVVATLIAAGNVLPGVYAQSSSTLTPRSFCPKGGSPVGLICVTPPKYDLPVGKWFINVNGVNGTLNISSVDSMGNVNGTMMIDTSQQSNETVVCPIDHPCTIQGYFDGRSGKISFTSTATIESLIPIIQYYTGHLSKRFVLDVILYRLAGTGSPVSPAPGPEFGWYATKSCIVPKCLHQAALGCLGAER